MARIPEQSAHEAIDWLRAPRMPVLRTEPLIGDAMKIAVGLDRSVYDSVYLALAVASGRPLVTDDERLANAVAARLPVRWLAAMFQAGLPDRPAAPGCGIVYNESDA
jgi:predicted nucleic acid-binding protein